MDHKILTEEEKIKIINENLPDGKRKDLLLKPYKDGVEVKQKRRKGISFQAARSAKYLKKKNKFLAEEEFGKILTEFFLFVRDQLVEGEDVQFTNIGTFTIVMRKHTVGKTVDWWRTKKMWKEKPHTEEQKKLVFLEGVEGRIPYIFWARKGILLYNKAFYSLKANSKLLTKVWEKINSREKAYKKY